MTCDVTVWTQSGVKSQKIEYLPRLFRYSTVVTLITRFHDMSTVNLNSGTTNKAVFILGR